MVQIKKPGVRRAIQNAAFQQISQKGYHAASMPAIARDAGITAGNIYRYYPSKFGLFFDVFAPWFDTQLNRLEADCARQPDAGGKLRSLLHHIWVTIPQADQNFARNLAQALATKRAEDDYSRDLLNASEARLGTILSDCYPNLPESDLAHIVRLIFMSHDGFVLNVQLAEETRQVEDAISTITGLLALSD